MSKAKTVNYNVYLEGLKIASSPDFEVEILYSTELYTPVWAVKDANSEFWFEAFDTRENAHAFCSEMEWTKKVIRD